jgi:1,4-dihydroxy-6-naphthoate synthase
LDFSVLKAGFSPCPNDTYLFYAWVHGLIDGPPIEPHIADVEELNYLAQNYRLPLTKLSIAMLKHCPDYRLLSCGLAMGFGCGPKLVAKQPNPRRIAIPGKYTTAYLLLQRYFPHITDVIEMRYDRIIDAILQGHVEGGLIIHETRFTFHRHDLLEVADLGTLWEEETLLPLPLGGIALHKSLDPAPYERALKNSLTFAHQNPSQCLPYIQSLSQEKDPTVISAHIATYINTETLHCSPKGQRALELLLMV